MRDEQNMNKYVHVHLALLTHLHRENQDPFQRIPHGEKDNHLLMERRVFHFPDSLDMAGDRKVSLSLMKSRRSQ